MKKYIALAAAAFLAAGIDSGAAFAQGGGMMGGWPGMMGFGGHPIDHSLVIPQIAVGQHYTTQLVLHNLGDAMQMGWVPTANLTTTGTVYFYAPDGSPLEVSVGGGPPISEMQFSLNPSATSMFELTGTGADASGWALVDVDEPNDSYGWGMMDGQAMTGAMRLMANVQYAYRDGEQPVSRVGVTPSVYEMGRFYQSVMPIRLSTAEGLSTGVAIVNTGDSSAGIDLDLRDSSGNVIANRHMTLAAGNQAAQYVDQLFDAVPRDFQGILEIHTDDEGVVAMGLLLSGGVMSSIPTMHYGLIAP